jgi:hypothetical protein
MRFGQKPHAAPLVLVVEDGERLVSGLLEELRGKLDVHPRQQACIGRTRELAETGYAGVRAQPGKCTSGTKTMPAYPPDALVTTIH